MSLSPAMVILAAGRSRRMGSPKALLPLSGTTVIQHLVSVYSEHWPVWIAANPQVQDELELLALPVRFIRVENPLPGLFSSVKIVAQRLRGAVPAVFVTPVDCVLPDAHVPQLLAGVAARTAAPVLVPEYNGRPGHPVMLQAEVLEKLAEADPEARFDALLDQFSPVRVTVTESAVLMNLNTPEDYAGFLRHQPNPGQP